TAQIISALVVLSGTLQLMAHTVIHLVYDNDIAGCFSQSTAMIFQKLRLLIPLYPGSMNSWHQTGPGCVRHRTH
ncbi:MAG: hypothetical protein QF516_03715, partial [Pirellulaceae bacterium]|nr:hypothetical protein [Pirellulaceae bacterium]